MLIAMAFPRLYASLIYIPVQAFLQQYQTTRQLPIEPAARFITLAKRSIAIQDLSYYWEGLGLLYYIQYQQNQKTAPSYIDQVAWSSTQKNILQSAIAATETALSRAPVKPALWWRLASLRQLLDYSPKRVIQALELSFLTGRFDRGLMFSRLGLSLLYKAYWNTDSQRLVRDQLKLAWQFEPDGLIQFLKSEAYFRIAVESLLQQQEAALWAEMRAALDQTP